MAFAARVVATDEGDIVVHERDGCGPPVVCVHGNSSAASSFEPLAATASFRDRRFIAVDLPGHGASPRRQDYGLHRHALALAAVLRTVPPALLLGHSLGGHVILQALARGLIADPRGIVIFGTPPMPDLGAVERAFCARHAMKFAFSGELAESDTRLWATEAFAPDPVPADFVAQLQRTDPNARLSLAANLADDFRDEVLAIASAAMPIAVLHAAGDAVISGAYLAALALPTAWRGGVVSIPDVGHYGHWTHPHLFAALIAAFELG